MQAIDPVHLTSLLVAVAMVSATCGYVGSAVVRRNKRRARGYFVLGFCSGLTAGTLRRWRRRGLRTIGAAGRRPSTPGRVARRN